MQAKHSSEGVGVERMRSLIFVNKG